MSSNKLNEKDEERQKHCKLYQEYKTKSDFYEKKTDNMMEIYESIIYDKKLEGHINFEIEKRKKSIEAFPYQNNSFTDEAVFCNILMSQTLSGVNGYFLSKDNLKIISFDVNIKDGQIGFDQNCLLPEKIFKKNFPFNSMIPPLTKEEIPPLID